MRVLSNQEVLGVWETGLEQHPVDRALSILSATLPGVDRNRLAILSVGRRDGYLMDVREANFGSRIFGLADCPGCQESLEWTLDLGDVRVARNDTDDEGGTGRLTTGGYELLFRLPDSTDLAAIAVSNNAAVGRDVLLRRCVLEARRGSEEVEASSLPEPVELELAAAMEARDPQAETLLDFECPSCGLRWQALFDVLTFLWDEICARARHLLNEVHSLASVYGWTEKDILQMSAARRRFYLEAAT